MIITNLPESWRPTETLAIRAHFRASLDHISESFQSSLYEFDDEDGLGRYRALHLLIDNSMPLVMQEFESAREYGYLLLPESVSNYHEVIARVVSLDHLGEIAIIWLDGPDSS